MEVRVNDEETKDEVGGNGGPSVTLSPKWTRRRVGWGRT